MTCGYASIGLAVGIDIGLVSNILGHSSIAITADTYSHLLDGVGREAAERAAALVPRLLGLPPELAVSRRPFRIGLSSR
ncbi:MAG: hypothetical protein ACRDRC_10375 [Pseudonocardiaceae bacterium]